MGAWLKRALPLILGLLYVLSPFDLIPDVLIGPGWLDDLAVLALLGYFLWRLQGRAAAVRRGSGAAGEGEPGPRAEGTRQPEEDPYAVLGLEPGASREEVKAAYRRLVAQYHPDKVTHLGKEFQDLAHRRLLQIQRAYQHLTGRTRRFWRRGT
ncbi:MAG: DnaJ domain-containing protein [candidate division NC10 bacterium]|nr:DnaJ domain-containing protein [candidate division NC10 bacterium]